MGRTTTHHPEWAIMTCMLDHDKSQCLRDVGVSQDTWTTIPVPGRTINPQLFRRLSVQTPSCLEVTRMGHKAGSERTCQY